MNIREVELETGLSRANVRHYEAKGILSPERHDNGYRDYTQEHIETLKRVKLLRQLDISLDDIVRLEHDELPLVSVLDARITSAQKEQQKAQKQQQVCQKMKDEGTTYRNLRVDSYLREMECENDSFERLYQVVQADQDPPVASAFRRVYARLLDEFLYMGIFMIIFRLAWPALFFAEESEVGTYGLFLSIIFHPLLFLVFEPFLLWIFGTTLGKFVLGLRIRNEDGRKLTLKHAIKRTASLLLYSTFAGRWGSYRMYDDMKNNAYMDWETTDEVLGDEFGDRHFIGGAVLTVVDLAILVVMWMISFKII